MKYYVKNQGYVSINPRDFVASGGEGSIYVKNSLAYKIYSDKSKMIPVRKIEELSKLNKDNIISPIDVVFNSKKMPVGYTMDFIKDNYVLCQLFTQSFKNRNNIKPKTVLNLVQSMQSTMKYIHSNNILVVDCNSMNFLVDKKFTDVYFIDVDSYQTPSFSATAIMEDIKDYQVKNNKFTDKSDWFSWGVLTFYLFVGIHPFKGIHKNIKTLEDRMRHNISVFNPDVSIPKVVSSFDVIPQAYRSWYESVFEKGIRTAPPTELIETIVITKEYKPVVTQISGSNKFEITEIIKSTSGETINAVYFHFGKKVIRTENTVQISNKSYDIKAETVGFTDVNNRVVAASILDNKLKLKDLILHQDIDINLSVSVLMHYAGRIYAVQEGSVYEIVFIDAAQKTVASSKVVANIMPKSSVVFDGVIVQNMVDACYVSIFPEKNIHCQIRVKEFEGIKVIDAKFDRKVLMATCVNKKGEFIRYTIRFDTNYKEYDIRETRNIQPSGLNFTVLDTNNCAQINEDENLVIFKNKIHDAKTTLVEDPILNNGMKLSRWDTEAIFALNDGVYRIKMK